MGSPEAKPLSRNKIRAMAAWLRKQLKLEDNLYFPIAQVIEWILASDTKFDYEIIPVEKMPTEYAKTYPERNMIHIREDVYEGVCRDQGRARFTLVHELFHYLQHTSENIIFARSSSSDRVPAYKNPEWQANTFAGELLVPKNLVEGLTIDEVMEKCGVSRQCAEIQMKEYGFVPSSIKNFKTKRTKQLT